MTNSSSRGGGGGARYKIQVYMLKKKTEEKNQKEKKRRRRIEPAAIVFKCVEEAYYTALQPPCNSCGKSEQVKFRCFKNRYPTKGTRISSFDHPPYRCRSHPAQPSKNSFHTTLLITIQPPTTSCKTTTRTHGMSILSRKLGVQARMK